MRERVSFDPHPPQMLLVAKLFILTILRVCSYYLIGVLICVFLLTKDIEHLFMCLFSMRISSSWSLFRSFVHLWVTCLIDWFMTVLKIRCRCECLSHICFADIRTHLKDWLGFFLSSVFWRAEVIRLIKPNLFISPFIVFISYVLFNKASIFPFF